jgi:hypothetical protein
MFDLQVPVEHIVNNIVFQLPSEPEIDVSQSGHEREDFLEVVGFKL